MKSVYWIIVAVILVVILAFAGSSWLKPAPAPAPEPTPVPTTETTVATRSPTTVVPTPEPVVTLPPKQDVDLALTKDRTYSTISLLYNGGGGELFTNKVEMRVTTSDGKVTDYVMNDGKAPKRGDEIVAQGTRGSDRCEVWVTSAGVRYKVMDQSLILGGAYEGNH